MRSEMGLLDRVGGSAFVALGVDVSAKRQESRLPVVAQPRTELMGAAKALDTANAGLEHPGCVFVRLQGPVRHAEGERRDGQGVTAREFLGRGGSLENIDPVDRVPMPLAGGAWCFRRLFGPTLGEYGAGRSKAGCFEEGAPAWTLRPIFRHVDQRCLSRGDTVSG
jgi:hypothetical protein